MSAQIIDALSKGNLIDFAKFAGVFLFIWIEVRGLKKEVAKISDPEGPLMTKLAEGEQRFIKIEEKNEQLEAAVRSIQNHLTLRQ